MDEEDDDAWDEDEEGSDDDSDSSDPHSDPEIHDEIKGKDIPEQLVEKKESKPVCSTSSGSDPPVVSQPSGPAAHSAAASVPKGLDSAHGSGDLSFSLSCGPIWNHVQSYMQTSGMSYKIPLEAKNTDTQVKSLVDHRSWNPLLLWSKCKHVWLSHWLSLLQFHLHRSL